MTLEKLINELLEIANKRGGEVLVKVTKPKYGSSYPKESFSIRSVEYKQPTNWGRGTRGTTHLII